MAVDAHGGDHGLSVTLPAAAAALRQDSHLHVQLVGRWQEIEPRLAEFGLLLGSRLEHRDAARILPMDAKPSTVLRGGRDSSLWQALQAVADGAAGACVSGGSTAALVALGLKLLGRLPGIQRPALMAHFPRPGGTTAMLDLGANLNVSATQLVQFAVMGSVVAERVDGTHRPRVALLNIGSEESKGHGAVREAHALLRALPLNYVGFIEGNEIFTGAADVAVCDGFTGNLVLKSGEGLSRMLVGEFRRALEEGMASRLGALLAGPALRRRLAPLDPSAHNGAPLLGLKGVVVKSHGSADCRGMTQAILEAGREARRKVPARIQASIRAFQVESES